jgi:glycosyltransferase involved in cell wall biosynthesis
MKILMLGWELPPHNSGGLGVACYQLCKTLSKKGAQIKFVVPYSADYDLDFMEVIAARTATPESIYGIYDTLDTVNGDKRLLSGDVFQIQKEYEKAVSGLVEEHEYDVIHAHDWLTFRAGLRARELSGKPLIVHVHSIESDRAGNKPGHPLVHEIEGIGLMLADQIIAVSEHTKQKIIKEYDIPQDKIIVAHNSIDTSMMTPLDSNNSYKYLETLKSQGYKVVTNIGRLTVQKGLTNLLVAAQRVIEHQPKTVFLIVGAGDQYFELLRLSADLGIAQNVVFAGFQRGKQWRDAFGVSDLFVMPSISEPFGLTPLEAIVYDTPSLISKQSGVSEVLNNCLKVDFWDIDKMADYIVSALRHDSLRESLLQNSKDEFTHLSWDKAAHTLMDVYQTHHVGVTT